MEKAINYLENWKVAECNKLAVRGISFKIEKEIILGILMMR